VFAIYPVMLYSLQNRGHKACSSHVHFIFAYLVLHEGFNAVLYMYTYIYTETMGLLFVTFHSENKV